VRIRPLVLLAALFSAGAATAAQPPPPAGGIPDIVGPRTLALSATIGAAAANEGLFVNPAALAARKRYSFETLYQLDRRGDDAVGQFLTGSVVDSISSPVTAGVSYLRAGKGQYDGNLSDFALAGPVADGLYLGVTGKYLSLTGVSGLRNVNAATADVGLFWQVTEYVSIGGAGYNLVSIDQPLVAPRGAGAGIALGSDRSFQVTADWRGDFDRAAKTTNRYAAGAEALLGNTLAIRGGYIHDETLSTDWWSAGGGLVTNRLALDVGYRQSIRDPSARTLAVALRAFFFE
jgi:hypothetical protein